MPLPAEITNSRIYTSGSYMLVSELFPEPVIDALQTEAEAARPQGTRNILDVSSTLETRGGNPARAFTSATAGNVQWSVFSAPAMLQGLTDRCGLTATPTGGGSYTFYEEPGDFLSLHRDIETCDLTLITCLKLCGNGDREGALLVYPDYTEQPLSHARDAGPDAAVEVRVRRGQSVALLGGIVPHEVTPMLQGQERIVSVMCYRVHLNGLPFS